MIIVFSIISFLGLLSFLFLIVLTYKKNPNVLGSWRFIVLITFYFITTVSSVYFVMMNHVENSTDYRPFITILTIIIAFISFTTSVFLTNRTTAMNKENQKRSFIMDLIKNNSLILNEKENGIDALIKQLDSQFKHSGYLMDKLVPLASNHFFYHRHIFQPSIDKIKAVNSTRIIPKEKTILEDAFNQDADSVERVLITYFELHPSGSEFNKKLDKSKKDKILGTALQRVIKDEKDLLESINRFVQSKESQKILGTDVSALSYSELKPLLEEQFEGSYKHLGHFFRNSYRVVKTINTFSEGDLEFKKTFLGILRSYYSENVLVAIYYNSVFTDKGIGYAKELALSDFFGDKFDLEHDKPIHFREESLYFKEKDLRTLKKIFTSDSPISSEIKKNEQKLSEIIEKKFDKA